MLLLYVTFSTANKSTQAENLNAQLENMTGTLRASFRTFFNKKEEHEENSKQILCILLDIMYQLTQEINFYETNGDEVSIFFKKLFLLNENRECVNHKILLKNLLHKVFDLMMKFTQLENMDPQASLTIFQILLWIEERNKEYGELLIDIAFALCEKIGSIDKVYNEYIIITYMYSIVTFILLLPYTRM